MVFKVPDFDPSDSEFRFEFQLPNGKKYSLPKIQYVPLSVMEEARKGEGSGLINLVDLIDSKVADALRLLAPVQIGLLEKEWVAESGAATVGESSASAS